MVRSNIPSSLTIQDNAVISGITPGAVAASKAVVVDASNDIVSGLNDLTVDGATVLTGLITATAGIVDLTSSKFAPVARTATATGATTGTIADAGSFQMIAVTAKSGDANGIIILPTPTPGTILVMYVGATGYEIRSDTPASVEIGGGTGASAESAVAAESVAILVCITATQWVGLTITDATLAVLEAAA
jgi:hypothetical protein